MLASYVSLLLLILASTNAEDVPEKSKRGLTNSEGNINQQTKYHNLHLAPPSSLISQNGNPKPYYEASNQEIRPSGPIQTYQGVPDRSYANLEKSSFPRPEQTNYKILPGSAKPSKLVSRKPPFSYSADQVTLNQRKPGFEGFNYPGLSRVPLEGLSSDLTGYQATYPQVSPTYQALIALPVQHGGRAEDQPRVTGPKYHQEAPEYLATTVQGQRTFQGQPGLQDRPVQANSPFLSPLSSFQGQVVPIHAASGQVQFPRFKGAAVQLHRPNNQISANGPLRQATAYQAIQTQPQLHFNRLNSQSTPAQPTNKPYTPPAQGFLNDVEIIDKEKPQRPKPTDEDDSGKEDDDGYKGVDFERSSQEPSTESHFKPSRSFPFQQYDEVFGKYSRPGQAKQPDKPQTEQKNYSTDEDSGEVTSRVRDDDSPGESSYESYESGEETRENQKETEGPTNDDYSFKSEPYRNYKDLDEEFEDSYRRDPPKQRYVHVKEVPEVPYGDDREQKESDEPRGQGSRVSYEVEKSSKLHEDKDGYRSRPSSRFSTARQDEPYGYRAEKKTSYGF